MTLDKFKVVGNCVYTDIGPDSSARSPYATCGCPEHAAIVAASLNNVWTPEQRAYPSLPTEVQQLMVDYVELTHSSTQKSKDHEPAYQGFRRKYYKLTADQRKLWEVHVAWYLYWLRTDPVAHAEDTPLCTFYSQMLQSIEQGRKVAA